MFIIWAPATIVYSLKPETIHSLVGNAHREVGKSWLFALILPHLGPSENDLLEQKELSFTRLKKLYLTSKFHP